MQILFTGEISLINGYEFINIKFKLGRKIRNMAVHTTYYYTKILNTNSYTTISGT